MVQAVYHAGANFSAGRLRTEDGKFVRFAGKVFVRTTMQASEFPCAIRSNGRQFAVEWLDAQVDLDLVGLANYLTNRTPSCTTEICCTQR